MKCPVCGQALEPINRIWRCENRHSYDVAKEGYVNLLSAHKSGDTIGDNREMALSRRDFLNKGYYQPLAQAVTECLEKYSSDGDTVLDITRRFYGFDLSKNMVRLAAKRKTPARFFVANIASIPMLDGSVKAAFHLFAPFHAAEFGRIIVVWQRLCLFHLYGY